jgi:cytoskeleton protein RodZ
MVLFRRIKTPFTENPPESEVPLSSGPRSAGEVLRQRRQEFGLTLEEAAAALRIKPVYLRALEEGRPAGLPGPAYAVGFTRSYSNFLGLDSGEVLRRLKAEKAELGRKPDLAFPIPLGERSLPSGSMLLVALILALCGYGGWYYFSNRPQWGGERIGAVPATLLSKPKPRPEPAKKEGASPAAAAKPAVPAAPAPPHPPAPRPAALSPSAKTDSMGASPPAAAAAAPPAPAPAASPTPRTSPAAAPPAAAPAAKKPADGPAPRVYGAKTSRIVIRASAASWIEVRAADGSILFERVLKPGESYRVPNEPGVTLRTGNAGALSIAVDGKSAPPLRGIGGVLRHVALDPRALLSGKAAGG